MSRANPHTTHDNAGIAAWRFKLKAEISSHQDAYNFLYDERALYARALGPDMIVRRFVNDPTMLLNTDPSCPIEIVLYDTPIIRYYNDGTFSVDNGGFNVTTTCELLTAVLPDGFWAYHYQKKLGVLHSDVPRANTPKKYTLRSTSKSTNGTDLERFERNDPRVRALLDNGEPVRRIASRYPDHFDASLPPLWPLDHSKRIDPIKREVVL